MRTARSSTRIGLLLPALLLAQAVASAPVRCQDGSPPDPAGAHAPAAAQDPAAPVPAPPAATGAAATNGAAGRRVTAAELESLARGEDELVAKVGDVVLRRSDAFRILDLAAPSQSADVIRNMVLSTAGQLEAAREGIDVDAAELERGIDAAISEQKASFALEVDEKLPLEEYLRRRHGFSSEQYRAEVRRMVLAAMLLERAVRLDQLRTDRDELELIVVEDEALARDIERQLAEGASISVLAKRHSVHPSAASGGVLPPVPASSDAALLGGRAALQPGQRLGPVELTVGDKTFWRILRLVDRAPASSLPWSELRRTIEDGLRERPLDPDELALFEARVVDRYGVTRFTRPP